MASGSQQSAAGRPRGYCKAVYPSRREDTHCYVEVMHADRDRGRTAAHTASASGERLASVATRVRVDSLALAMADDDAIVP